MSKAKVVIKRNKWRCGGNSDDIERIGEGHTKLLNKHGFMCCLGFACKQLGGLSNEDLDGHSTPAFRVIPHLSETLPNTIGHFKNTPLTEGAITINDNRKISTSEREQKLTALFNKYGVELKFVNQYRRKDRAK